MRVCRCLFQHPVTQRERDALMLRLAEAKAMAAAARRAGDHQHRSLTDAAVLYVQLYTPCEPE